MLFYVWHLLQNLISIYTYPMAIIVCPLFRAFLHVRTHLKIYSEHNTYISFFF